MNAPRQLAAIRSSVKSSTEGARQKLLERAPAVVAGVPPQSPTESREPYSDRSSQ